MSGGVNIVADGVTKAFAGGRVRALRGVNLHIGAGEWVAITGPTGAGKSTLLSLLAMLDLPDSGRLEFDGVPIAEFRPPERWRASNLGIVFQLHHLMPHLTLVENVALPLLGRGWRWSAALRKARDGLACLELDHRAEVLAMLVSGGERQLASVARALIGSPRLVLADEPTGNVDPATGKRIVDTLEAWHLQSGGTLVTVTHQPALSRRAGRVIHLTGGVIAVHDEAGDACETSGGEF